jgi:hypothetical protein
VPSRQSVSARSVAPVTPRLSHPYKIEAT